ncbi:MAG: phosphopyruvate hydratase, partial [Candidatus Micrarchaeia archaeon]
MASAVFGVKIQSVRGFQILDSRNNPTVACRMRLTDGHEVWFKVPSGASTGKKEAKEFRDKNLLAWRRKGVTKAVKNLNEAIAPIVEGIPVGHLSQEKFDRMLIDLDGTTYKSKLGANAILPVSGAYARAMAQVQGMALWEYFTGCNSFAMPVPQLNVFNGGKHADSGTEVQEIMVVPAGARSFGNALEMGTGTWYKLKALLKKAGFSTGRGEEGGFV